MGTGRVWLQAFPYHLLFEETEDFVHFLVLRHDSRHPSYGMKRRLMG